MRSTAITEVSRGSLWFGLIGGGIAWTIHLLSAYAVAEFGCVGQLGARSFGSISLVAWLELGVTAVTFLIAAAATAISYQCLARMRAISPANSNLEPELYSARAGLYASAIFAFVILFESIPILFYLRSC